MRYVNTEHEMTCLGQTCSYCGKASKHEIEYADRDTYDYYSCDCEGAKLEIEKQEMNRKYNNQLSEFKRQGFKKLNKMKYEYELSEVTRKLKRDYGI